VAGLGVAAANFIFLFVAWACLRLEWGCILCTCAPLMLVQPGYLLWYAIGLGLGVANRNHGYLV